MPLVIDARLREGRYDAADGWRDVVEWPPHPSRLFCALVASAHSDPERAALRWLEQQQPPQVWASESVETFSYRSYVVTNRTESKGGNQAWPGRTAAPRHRVAGLPRSAEFAFVWPDADPHPQLVEVLGELAWRVPYLGRSTSTVALRVHTAPKPRAEWRIHAPAALDSPNTVTLGVPYPGYLEELDAAFADGRRAWEVRRTIAYAPLGEDRPANSVQAVRGPFAHMLVFAFAPGTVRPEGSELLVLTRRLRDAVMARIGSEVPPEVSGHAADGQRHVGYLAFPDVGHRHARGHLLGVGLALPAGMSPVAWTKIRAALVDVPLERLVLGQRGAFDLVYQQVPDNRRTLNPRYWSAGQRGSREWVSATPLMLDHFARRNSDLGEFVRRSVVTAGYPDPVEVAVSVPPLTRGAILRPPKQTFPQDRPRRRIVHARLRFAEPVIGPVLVGSMRYLGMGLFTPTASPAQAPESERND